MIFTYSSCVTLTFTPKKDILKYSEMSNKN